ncbi:MAG TPA: SusE domain-containing protein [Chitinophagaceae bacterium]|nr:SusE domain-containing protein [Chitinophagaceae bacterium]
MKLRNILMLFMVAVAGFTACDKLEDLPVYGAGIDPVMTASATTIAASPTDSLKDVLTLDWSDPKYATDTTNVKFLVLIDSAGRNFAKASVREVMAKRTTTYTARDLNNIMLGFGFEFNKPYDLDVRVVSSYANNNERRNSNIVKVKATPYKIPPKVALPTTGKLFLVGDASEGGWSNPVPVPTQEFARIDETTFAGIFKMKGGKQYLILPLNGNWDNKYSVANNTLPDLNKGGEFRFNASDNFPGPTADGEYKIVLDFQQGKFTVTPYTQQHGLPLNLFIVGDATPGSWDNPVPVPAQQFTRLNSTVWELPSLNLITGKAFLLLPENGNWNKKYGLGNTADFIEPQGPNIPAPAATGNYKITVNFLNNSIKLVKL